MKAVRVLAPGQIACENQPECSPIAGEVKIKIAYCGICGSDVHIVKGEVPAPYPLTIGHEFSGTVAEVGEGVTRFSVGERVTAQPMKMVDGKEELVGCSLDGGMADYVCVQQGYVYHLPDSVSFEDGALLEPACVSAHAVFAFANLLPNDMAVVVGAGPIGLMAAIFAKSCGAKVALVGRTTSADRLALGKTLGADYTFMSDRDNVPMEIMQLTAGKGAAVVFECGGSEKSISDSLVLLRKGGKLIELALPSFTGTAVSTYFMAVINELSMQGSFCHSPADWEKVIAMAGDKQVCFDGIVTAKFPFDRCEEAFATKGVKILMHP